MVVVYAVLAPYSLSCILGFIVDFESAKESMPIFIMILLFAVFIFISYRSQVKALVQRDKEMSGGEPICCEISVSDDEMTLTALESRSPVSVSNLKSAFITKNYIVVITKARLMFIFKKDAFTQGDAEGLIAFLKEKGVKTEGKNN